MKKDLPYIRFLNLARALEEMPKFPALDAVESGLLNACSIAWYQDRKLATMEALEAMPEISQRTKHSRLKILADKGMIKVESDEYDARGKYIVPTALALKYYETLGKYLAKSQATSPGSILEAERVLLLAFCSPNFHFPNSPLRSI